MTLKFLWQFSATGTHARVVNFCQNLASASEKWVAWRQWAVFSAVSSWQKTFTTPVEYFAEFGQELFTF